MDLENKKDKLKKKQVSYYLENSDKIKEKVKQYKEENKDKVKEQQKKYRTQKVICACSYETTQGNLKNHQQTLKHRLLVQKYNTTYIINGKSYTSEEAKQRTHCECGSYIKTSNLEQHQKSNKHIKLMKSK